MDENRNGNGNTNYRNWDFLDLTSSIGGGGSREPPPPPVMAASSNCGPSRHQRVSGIFDSRSQLECFWLAQNKDKYPNSLPLYPNPAYYLSSYGVSPETSFPHSFQMPPQINLPKNDTVISEVEELGGERDSGDGGRVAAVKKRGGGGKVTNSAPKEKKPRTKTHRGAPQDDSTRAKAPKKKAEVVINGINMDVSDIPIPVCSCTGNSQQCYRWGSGGWQSACCTTGLSVYPLPMSTKRRGARIAGRKMSIGAFKKVLEKLSSEGYDFSSPIDLRSYWARHGTNKFVTIR